MIKLERFGCPKAIIAFVLPIGNSLVAVAISIWRGNAIQLKRY
jgi:hypothetical protein